MFRPVSLVFFFLGVSGSVMGQDFGDNQKTDMGGSLGDLLTTEPMWADVSPSVTSWKQVLSDVQEEEVVNTLEAAGWSSEYWSSRDMTAGSFDVYTKGLTPGISKLLVVPRDGGVPSEFNPVGDALFRGGEVTAEPAFLGVSAESIEQRVASGMAAALDALCDMPVAPGEIRAQISAYVIEVEATWDSSEVCNRHSMK